MKSPDRDAADELFARLAESRTRIAHMCSHHHPPRMSIPADRERDDDLFICDTLDQSELATLRRRVAELESGLHEIDRGALLSEVIEEAGSDDLPSQMAWRSARLIAKRCLSPPTRKE